MSYRIGKPHTAIEQHNYKHNQMTIRHNLQAEKVQQNKMNVNNFENFCISPQNKSLKGKILVIKDDTRIKERWMYAK